MIRWLIEYLFGEAHDPAWKPTGYRQSFSGHDEAKAEASAVRADREAIARRKLAAKRVVRPVKKSADIVEMPRRHVR